MDETTELFSWLRSHPVLSVLFGSCSFVASIIGSSWLQQFISNPLLRWVAFGLLTLLFGYWVSNPPRSQIAILSHNGSPIFVPMKKGVFFLCMATSLSALLVDLYFTVFSQQKIAYVNNAAFSQSWHRASLVGQDESSERMHPFKQEHEHLTTTQISDDVSWLNTDFNRTHVSFSITKTTDVDEIVIDDISIVVHSMTELPSNLSFTHLHSLITASGVDRVVVPIDLHGTHTLPKSFSHRHVFSTEFSDEVLPAEAVKIVIRSPYSRTIHVVPLFKQEGVYEITAEASIRTNYSLIRRINLFNGKRTITVYNPRTQDHDKQEPNHHILSPSPIK